MGSLERKIQRQQLMKQHKKAHNKAQFNKIWEQFQKNQKGKEGKR
jgi:hypothetical protein